MTPRDVLMEFETNRTAPVAAMRAALSAREEMLPAFVAEFERALHTSLENLPYADSYGIMLEILGEWGDSRAYLPLAAFLRLPGDTLDVLLGDGITETADRVMARVVTSDLNPIFDILPTAAISARHRPASDRPWSILRARCRARPQESRRRRHR